MNRLRIWEHALLTHAWAVLLILAEADTPESWQPAADDPWHDDPAVPRP